MNKYQQAKTQKPVTPSSSTKKTLDQRTNKDLNLSGNGLGGGKPKDTHKAAISALKFFNMQKNETKPLGSFRKKDDLKPQDSVRKLKQKYSSPQQEFYNGFGKNEGHNNFVDLNQRSYDEPFKDQNRELISFRDNDIMGSPQNNDSDNKSFENESLSTLQRKASLPIMPPSQFRSQNQGLSEEQKQFINDRLNQSRVSQQKDQSNRSFQSEILGFFRFPTKEDNSTIKEHSSFMQMQEPIDHEPVEVEYIPDFQPPATVRVSKIDGMGFGIESMKSNPFEMIPEEDSAFNNQTHRSEENKKLFEESKVQNVFTIDELSIQSKDKNKNETKQKQRQNDINQIVQQNYQKKFSPAIKVSTEMTRQPQQPSQFQYQDRHVSPPRNQSGPRKYVTSVKYNYDSQASLKQQQDMNLSSKQTVFDANTTKPRIQSPLSMNSDFIEIEQVKFNVPVPKKTQLKSYEKDSNQLYKFLNRVPEPQNTQTSEVSSKMNKTIKDKEQQEEQKKLNFQPVKKFLKRGEGRTVSTLSQKTKGYNKIGKKKAKVVEKSKKKSIVDNEMLEGTKIEKSKKKSFVDNEMFEGTKIGRTQLDFYQTTKIKFDKEITLKQERLPKNQPRASSTLSAGNAPNFIKLYNPNKMPQREDSSKLILSQDNKRPFSPPQKQFIPTAKFHTNSAQRVLESRKNASKVKVKDMNILIKSTVESIQESIEKLSPGRQNEPEPQFKSKPNTILLDRRIDLQKRHLNSVNQNYQQRRIDLSKPVLQSPKGNIQKVGYQSMPRLIISQPSLEFEMQQQPKKVQLKYPTHQNQFQKQTSYNEKVSRYSIKGPGSGFAQQPRQDHSPAPDPEQVSQFNRASGNLRHSTYSPTKRGVISIVPISSKVFSARKNDQPQPVVGNILDDLKKEIRREDVFKQREDEVMQKLARTDQMINSKYDSRRSSKKTEITRIDSLTRVAVKNQDSFYNKSFINLPSNNKNDTTLNLDGSILKPLATNANVGRDYLGESINDLSMIHPDEPSRMVALKTIKSELEEEDESMYLGTEPQEKESQRFNSWGLKPQNYYHQHYPSETPSGSSVPMSAERYQFQHLKNVQKQQLDQLKKQRNMYMYNKHQITSQTSEQENSYQPRRY